jgi:hypothetical protein
MKFGMKVFPLFHNRVSEPVACLLLMLVMKLFSGQAPGLTGCCDPWCRTSVPHQQTPLMLVSGPVPDKVIILISLNMDAGHILI